MKSTHACSFALSLSLLFSGLIAVAVRGEPNQAGAMRDFDAIEPGVAALEREHVAGLLSAYIDGLGIAGEDHPSVQR